MYSKIIIGYDGSDNAEDALALGREVGRATAAELVVVGVFPSGPFVDAEQQRQFAHKVQSAADLAGAEAEAFPSNSPARGLHDAAWELGADLVVVGSSSSAGTGHMRAGGVALSLLHGSPCAVAVAPAGLHKGEVALKEIGVALDGSQESRDAQNAAVALARATGAKLRLLTVGVPAQATAFGWGYGMFDIEDQLREEQQRTLDEAAAQIPAGIEVDTELLVNGTVPGLLSEAAETVDLLCLGSRGYGPARRVLLGSTSAPIVKQAPCAVLVIPRGIEADSAEEPHLVAAEPA
jgi:nucleotide-binding universal stress UspA family protein